MADQKPTLDYRTVPPEQRRLRFLEKLNPDATPQSMVLSAVRMCIFADTFFLVASFRGMIVPWPLFATAMLLAVFVGIVTEWQTLD